MKHDSHPIDHGRSLAQARIIAAPRVTALDAARFAAVAATLLLIDLLLL